MRINTPVALLCTSAFLLAATAGAQDTGGFPGEAPKAPPPTVDTKKAIYLPMPSAALEEFKAPDKGIDAKVWQPLDPAVAAQIKEKHARMPRKVVAATKSIAASRPDQPRMSQATSEVTVLSDGFIYIKSTGGGETSDAGGTSLTWMGLIPVYSRAHVAIQSMYLIEGTVTSRLLELKRMDFNPTTLAPGVSFGFDRTTRRTTYTHVVGPLHTTSPKTADTDLVITQQCTAGERVPATDVAEGLSGTALKVSCTFAPPEGSTLDYFYLEDYAWFYGSGSRTKAATVEGRILSVEK